MAGSAEKVIVWAAARERRRDTGRRENCMLMIVLSTYLPIQCVYSLKVIV